MSWNYMTFHAMQINSSILGNFQIMSNLKIWQDYLHNLESQSFLALALAFHLPNTKSTILSDTKELLRNMLLHLTTLLQSMLMPHTLANNDIQTSTIIHLSLLKIHSKYRIPKYSIQRKGADMDKLHIFWEGHKILRYLHLSFVL